MFMTKGKKLTTGVFKEEGTQPFVTDGVLRGTIVQAGFTSAIRLGPGRCRICSLGAASKGGCAFGLGTFSTNVSLEVRYSATLLYPAIKTLDSRQIRLIRHQSQTRLIPFVLENIMDRRVNCPTQANLLQSPDPPKAHCARQRLNPTHSPIPFRPLDRSFSRLSMSSQDEASYRLW